MTNLASWAARHAITPVALYELRTLLTGAPYDPQVMPGTSEAAIQSALRVAASARGWRLWRNNNGAGKLENGSFVRWGLANDSAKINEHIKSADLIGIKPGGQFVSREVKAAGWQYTGTPREQAQRRWIELVTALGGDASFTTGTL